MRAFSRLLPVLIAAQALSCVGAGGSLVAPPSAEMSIAVLLNPDASGGMRPSTTVSALVFVENVPNAVVSGALASGEFTVRDAMGGVLARESVVGPLAFGPNGTITVRRVLDWTPPEALGRSLTVRFVVAGNSAALERTVTF